MARVMLQVQGGRELRRSMRQAGVDLAELKGLGKRVGAIVGPAARERTPRGPQERGHIQSTVRLGYTQTSIIVRAGTGAKGRYPYANPLHWGWKKRKIKAQPWVSLAAQQTEPRWIQVYMRGIDEIITRVRGAESGGTQ